MTDAIPDTIAVVPPAEGQSNRGYDNRITSADSPALKMTLETANQILMDYLTNTIQPTIDDNGTARAVPVIYGTPERWKTVQQDGFFRDPASSKAQTPLIMLRRTKETFTAGLNNPNNKYVYTTQMTGWNRRNAYDQFAVRNKIRPSRQYQTVVIPDYLDLTYEMMFWTEYQEQLDAIIQQVSFEAQEYWGTRNNWKFRVNIPEFTGQSELPAQGERVIRSNATMTVKAYLLPESMVQNFRQAATTQKYYSTKKVIAMTEVTGSIKN